jgi:lactoylglutathione lyase
VIDRFGKVMVYVEDPTRMADFWVQQLGFHRRTVTDMAGTVLSVEVAHDVGAGASLVLIDRAVVAATSPEVGLGTPSILFASLDAARMRENLLARGVSVGELVRRGPSLTFHFADPEGHYFAVEQIV